MEARCARAVAALAAVALAVFCAFSLWIESAGAANCPNESLRQGAAKFLPDCRAYELASATDSNGHPIEPLNSFAFGAPFDLFPSELGSPSGDSLAYMTYSSPLASPPGSNGGFDVYVADRTSGGWSTTRRLSPSGAQAELITIAPGGVSPDHQYAFTHVHETYLVNPDGSLEVAGVGNLGADPQAQGRFISDGGRHVIFTTGKAQLQSKWCVLESTVCHVRPLQTGAPPEGTGAVYDREADGPTHVVSLLPGDVTPSVGEEAFYKGTSKDASSVAFEIGGTLYVRIDNGNVLAEETVEVAQGEPTYAGLSDDGRYVFYVVSGTIHRFDTTTEGDVAINSTGDAQIVNISGGGSHVYFISEEKIGGAGASGSPNLFVWRSGTVNYIATVAPSDLERTSGELEGIPALTTWTTAVTNPPQDGEQGPGADSSRTTPDGSVLVFESRTQLTAYDNDGKTEIYRYDDSDDSLVCVSCNPQAEPPGHDARLEQLALLGVQMVVHNLSADGDRIFFETDEALVERDTDGVNDIYEWSEGSVWLISSGESAEFQLPEPRFLEPVFIPRPNTLISVTPSGDDAFFLSQDALVPGAPEGGATVVYDARVNGGFASAPTLSSCEEEGCRPPAQSQAAPETGVHSEATRGAGNVKLRKHRCRRAKASKHKRCKSKRHRRHRHKQASASAQADTGSAAATPARAEDPGESSSANPPSTNASTSTTSSPATLAGGATEFGIKSVGAEESNTTAGASTDFTNLLKLNYHFVGGLPKSDARTENVTVSLPPGLLGNPNAVPKCKTGQLVAYGNCPPESQIGLVHLAVEDFGRPIVPIYNMQVPHPDREIARLGFTATLYPVFVDVKVRTSGDYGVTATVQGGPSLASLLEANTTLWGNPASPSHDLQRFTAAEEIKCDELGEPEVACLQPGKKREVDLPETAFMTNSSACQEGEVGFQVTSYQLPGQVFSASAQMPQTSDCQGLPFAPSFSAEPTSHAAGAPTGLQTKLTLPQHLGAEERSTATMREARVTLPEGMQIAAGAANWIDTCSEAQVGFHEEVDVACPDASKLGTARIVSPSLPEPIEGALYQRTPTPGHQFGLWLVADALGLHIKLPGELEPDKQSGRLTAVFRDLPQVPVEEIDLDVWGGSRAPLQNPASCGTYTTDFSFSPHSQDPAATGQDQMQIDEGCRLPFDPIIHAGVENALAGHFSPFVFDLTRPDGSQALRGFELHLPQGELAKLAGVPLCSDGAAAAGACPTGSKIGSLTAVSGPGPDPLQIPQPGKAEPAIYLAGPYQGAPYSIVSEVPAQAGPFDLGILAVRSGLEVDPETAQATVKADPLPQFFEGVGIAYRRLHAVVDRPGFSLNPTDCREMAITSDIASTQGTVAHPASRFQVDGCKALKFKPRLSLRLKGGSKRGEYPALTATLKARKGDANIAKASVGLPHSEFLAQEHIVTICTRVQFAADKCPRGSIYGKAKAWTPLLDKPLEGPVYLRSSNHPLPDMVVALRGALEIDLVGRIDSHHGGIRSTVESVPDAPVSKFVLRMKGGAKGLLVNSTDICRGSHRASVAMRAQNGRAASLRPPLENTSCSGKKLGNHKKHH